MPDVDIVLQMMAALNLPRMETLPPVQARAFMEMMSAQRPRGPEVGETVDGAFPGPAGPQAYPLYRPATPGPHPVALYFHGGGWVVGNQASDDPLCRDLCVRSNAILVSVDYRHGPEHRFPAAHEDGFAALQWASQNAYFLSSLTPHTLVSGKESRKDPSLLP